jgi:murein DD-endopeptidase MepM/ murein hydrolase activator NlpD
MRQTILLLSHLLIMLMPATYVRGQTTEPYVVQPGDTWAALAMRYGVEQSALKTLNPHLNAARQPVIGRPFVLPQGAAERAGRMIRPNDGGLLQTAATYGFSPWGLAGLNDLASPYRPPLYRPLYLPGEGTIRDLPPGIKSLELSQVPAVPGAALGLRGMLFPGAFEREAAFGAALGRQLVMTSANGDRFIGLVGTGAFFAEEEPELVVRVGDEPIWSQPWAFGEREWEYQELTLTGEAAQIDQQARDEERARLHELWAVVSSGPQWATDFATPITDTLSISANYGARRSYNGGPFLTYHEGVDFSAYGGTPVFAPAAGRVALAEPLYVRGGAVIIDHGLGVYTGYYHLSAIHATAGQQVQPGDLLGEVGTTGLSTGNHLHWDLLINGVWVDAALWRQEALACWLLEGLGNTCVPSPVD